MKIDVLGQEYNLFFEDDDKNFNDCDGYCYPFDKKIRIKDKYLQPGESDKGKEIRLQEVIRHELVHAFCQESGVDYDEDEQLVDWIARMIPKIESVVGKINNQRIEVEKKKIENAFQQSA